MATGFAFLIHISSVIVSFIAVIEAEEWVSPCPRLFVYETSKNRWDRWFGIITLLSDSDLSGVWLRVTFDQPIMELGNYFGEVKRRGPNELLIKNREFMLGAHIPKTIDFYLRYGNSRPIPKLIGFRLNGKTLCPENQPDIETVTLVPMIFKNPDANDSATATQPAVHTVRYPCGKSSKVEVAPLILHGHNSTEGEWPWHTALYKNYQGSFKYICGGTVVSSRFIVTAAHCVTDLSTGYVFSPSNLLIHVGTTNLKDLPSSTQTLQISRIIAHPEFSRSNLHNDIALLRTSKPLEYTTYVSPVCLWRGNNDLQSVVGQKGTVVGWGTDEKHQFSAVLKQTQMPIVDTVECIYSKPQVFGKLTSHSSYCAGYRNGSGACNGDSGSGMVIERPNENGEKAWHLRGVVSLSVASAGGVCDPKEYIIFTDASKFGPWITKTVGENQ